MGLLDRFPGRVQAPATAPHPEVELLLCCARTRVDAGTTQRIQTLVQQPVDWGQLLERADQQGLLPLLYQNLKALCATMIPPAVLEQLSQQAFTNAARNMLRTRALLRLLSLFKAHGIPALPFKGPVLAATAYDNLSLRQFGDLDIMIHERDIGKAKDLLVFEGYQIQLKNPMTAEQEAKYRLNCNCDTFISADGDICIDLHWRFLFIPSSGPGLLYRSFSAFNLDRVWLRLQTILLAGTPVLTFSPEDQLLYLCVHGCKHLWSRLLGLCDIAELIQNSPGLEWDWVLEQAEVLGIERLLLLSLALVHEVLETALPAAVLQRIQADAAVRSLATQLKQRLLDPTFFYQIKDYSNFTKSFFYFKMIERVQDKMLFLYRTATYITIPNEADREYVRLPPWLGFLYFLVKPVRLLARHTPLVRQKLLHKLKN